MDYVRKIGNLKTIDPARPIFQTVLGARFEQLPVPLKDHYAVRPYSRDEVVIEGTLDVRVSCLVGLMSRLFGVLVPRSGRDIPVRVRFSSGPDSETVKFEREFLFPGHKPVRFDSRLEWRGGKEIIERMRMGLGWRFSCEWENGKIRMVHKGYVLRILGLDIPMPVEFIIGRGYGEEEAVTEDTFRMLACMGHPWFGQAFSYQGRFRIKEVSCPVRS